MYLKVTIDTFSKLACNVATSYVHASNVTTWKSEVWEQHCVLLFDHSNFERNFDVLKSKSPGILLNENINFNKNETESIIYR